MNAYRFDYTMTVKCFDGVTRTFDRHGYFVSFQVLCDCLSTRDGRKGPLDQPYHYYVTGKQLSRNKALCTVPNGERVHHGPYNVTTVER